MFNLRYSFASFKNKVFFDDFNSALKKQGRAFPPVYVLWDCSRNCNLHCVHCGATKEKYSKEISSEEIKKVIDELSALKVRFFAVTGGEPLLRKDLLEILFYAHEKGIKTGIASNGYLIDRKTAEQIKLAGVSSIQISLDGAMHSHNRIRGNNESFQRAVNSIKFLKEAGIPVVSVATTVTPANLNELPELMDILTDLNVRLWRLCVVMPIGRAEDLDFSLSSAQLKQFFCFVKSNKSKIEIKIGENLPFLADFEKQLRKKPLLCPVGFTACCIGVDGNVRGCPEQPDTEENREGSVLKKSFAEIWKNGFKKYRSREILFKDKKCAECKKKLDCFGGCWVMRRNNQHCIYTLLE